MHGDPRHAPSPTASVPKSDASSGHSCIFVIGMHRSGTSATAGTLDALGITSPSGSDLLAAGEWNQNGFFESKRLVAFNNQLLSALGGTWSAPPKLEPGWDRDPALEELRADGRRAFAETFPSRPMAWKDPRNCITLPFWRTVITPPFAGVFVYRNPLEVARSLQTRNGDGMLYGLALWDRHVRTACANLVGIPTLATDYARVLEQPSVWIDDLTDFLGSIGVHVDAAAHQAAIASLDAGLRHHRTPPDRTSGLWDDQFEVFDVLRELDGAHHPWNAPDIGPEPEWVDEVLRLRLDGDRFRRIERIMQTSRAFGISRFVGKLRHRGRTAGLLRGLGGS